MLSLKLAWTYPCSPPQSIFAPRVRFKTIKETKQGYRQDRQQRENRVLSSHTGWQNGGCFSAWGKGFPPDDALCMCASLFSWGVWQWYGWESPRFRPVLPTSVQIYRCHSLYPPAARISCNCSIYYLTFKHNFDFRLLLGGLVLCVLFRYSA